MSSSNTFGEWKQPTLKRWYFSRPNKLKAGIWNIAIYDEIFFMDIFSRINTWIRTTIRYVGLLSLSWTPDFILNANLRSVWVCPSIYLCVRRCYCVSICMSIQAITLEPLDQRTPFWAHKASSTYTEVNFGTKAIGSKSSSNSYIIWFYFHILVFHCSTDQGHLTVKYIKSQMKRNNLWI